MKDYAWLQVIEADQGIIHEMSEHFTFEVPGAKYMPAVKARRWDGKVRMFNKLNGEINAGLYWSIKKFCAERGYGIKVEEGPYGYPYDQNKVPHMAFQEFLETLNLPFKPRDYQYDAIVHGIENKRCVLLSPTGSGKSFIIYLLSRWYLANHDKKILLIVPTTSLVEQMYKDFSDYGYDSEKYCHRIYSGKEKETDHPVVISTWQSIYKLGPGWFQKFGCVFGDEVHLFKAKSLSSIMNKSNQAEYRFGTTGTLDGTTVNKLVLEGLFGPVNRVTTTHELQKKEALAKLNIDIILLKYSREHCQLTDKRSYQDEIDFLVTYEKRNKFIANLATSQNGNTLVLFNLVDRHGKVLRNLIEERLKDGQRFFYVSGETKTSDREQIRNIVDKQKNSIILASLGTFSTGINIKNIHNIIFASPSKSQVRVLQSIGRGLRLSDDGTDTQLFDIADDLHYKSKKNFTLTHSAERIKIYTREKFPFKITQVVI
jgi:superfamily II DNA or RNA helicase